jgi:hypothetical protein
MDISGMRQELVKSSIGAMATILLGMMVAGVSGIFSKIDDIGLIKKAQEAQTLQVLALKEQLDKRKEDATDSKVSLASIIEQHRFLIDQLRDLRAELAAARKQRD